MTPQATITIPVPPEIAQAYSLATETERQQIAHKIAFFLKTNDLSRQAALQKLHQTMDVIGQRATERGLTPEILETILNEDE